MVHEFSPQVGTRMVDEFIRGLRPNLAVSDGDKMYDAAAARHYEFVGRSDLSVVLNALNLRATYPGGDAAISDVFDFGCGHGRATRWFRAAFPEAAIWVTDLDQAGVDWCVKQFGCKDTRGDIPADRFDVVWLGSVFTHLPRQIAEGLIDNLLTSLKPNGLLIFTTQGRSAVRIMEASLASDVPGWMRYHLERDSAEDLIRQYNEEGYGFVNFPRRTDYGVCVAKSHWYSDRILKHDRYIQILMQEKGSDNHQDVLAFMRADLNDLRKGPLY
jgi:SAM-dependent methyltransferase